MSTTNTGILNGGEFEHNPTINTDDGNDIISGTGYYVGILTYATIDTGDGNDTIMCNADVTSPLDTIGVDNPGTINTGDGNDTITGTARYGILNQGIIDTGDGNDTIIGIGNNGDGIQNSGTIHTGKGNDIIDALKGGFSTEDGIILLEDGNDIVKGFGSGRFDSGLGEDTLLFGPGTYTVSCSANNDGFYTVSNGSTDMLVKNFELIGDANNHSNVFSFTSAICGPSIVIPPADSTASAASQVGL